MYMHNVHCPIESRTANGHSDAARRIADTYNLHRIADLYGNIGKWFACRLDDGTSDNVLYDSKASAIRHQKHNENYYTFIQIVPAQMTMCEADVMLRIARMAYDAGMRNTGDESRVDFIKRIGWEDQIALSKGIVTNIRLGRKSN
jgi:hypothetical protein